MPLNYEKWDLSLKDYMEMIFFAAGVGFASGYLFYDSIAVGTGIAFLTAALKPRYIASKIEKRRKILLLQFRDLLYSISSSLSVGRSMSQALEESIDFWQGVYSPEDFIMVELSYMVRKIREGNESDVNVLEDFASRSGLTDVWDFVNVYKNCRSSGGNMILAVNRAASIIGDKIMLEKELESLMAQKRFEGRIVMLAPFAIMLFLKIVSPEYLKPLTASSKGMIIATAALALICTALYMTERINRIEV